MKDLLRSFLTDFADLVARQPDKAALLDSEGRIVTYSKLADYIENAQALLTTYGMRPGDVVTTLLPNAIETLIIFLASLRGGYIYAPLSCAATLTEVQQWKGLTKSKLCLIAAPVSTSLQEQIAVMDWRLVTIPIGGDLGWLGNGNISANGNGRLLISSSGSTGEPKAIVLDGDRLWSAGCAFLRYHQIETSNTRFWNYLPMSYIGGLSNLGLIPLAAGGSIFVDEPFNGKTFLTFWSTVEQFEINSLWLVPSILRGLLVLAERVGKPRLCNHIERCYIGTAPISLAEKKRFTRLFGIEPMENYGLSETAFISSECGYELAFRQQGTVGKVMPDVEVKISSTDSEDDILREILVRTPFMMLGYLDTKGRVELPLDNDGFFRSGDYGSIVNGQLAITGRRRDIVKKGGILVALREIELIAESFENILEAVAVRIDHPFYGESYILYIRPNLLIIDETVFLIQFTSGLHAQLVRYKWPERIVLRKDFPRTASGKVQKHLLSMKECLDE